MFVVCGVTVRELPLPEQKKMLGIIQDITERKELELKLEQQANTDFLTEGRLEAFGYKVSLLKIPVKCKR